jgi:hypothetical protein
MHIDHWALKLWYTVSRQPRVTSMFHGASRDITALPHYPRGGDFSYLTPGGQPGLAAAGALPASHVLV